jgi:hypothetical protein
MSGGRQIYRPAALRKLQHGNISPCVEMWIRHIHNTPAATLVPGAAGIALEHFMEANGLVQRTGRCISRAYES